MKPSKENIAEFIRIFDIFESMLDPGSLFKEVDMDFDINTRNLLQLFPILIYLDKHQSCNMKEIVELLDVSRSGATTIIDKFVSQKILSRTVPESDRRSVILEIGQNGRIFLQEYKKLMEKKAIMFLSNLNLEEQELLLQLLSKINPNKEL